MQVSQGPEQGTGLLGATMWVLRTEPWSSPRVLLSVLNISLDRFDFVFLRFFFLRISYMVWLLFFTFIEDYYVSVKHSGIKNNE